MNEIHTMDYFGMGHILEQMFVWLIGFQIYMCPGFLLPTNHDKYSFLRRVCSKPNTSELAY